MKILVYTLNYSPELTGVGKYSGEMVNWLSVEGHDVRVVTGYPYYPQWRVLDGYRARWFAFEQRNGVQIFRCPLWVPRKPGGLKRLVHLALFSFFSFFALIRQVSWRPDVVWVVAPAFFCLPGALLVSKLSGAKSWVHIQDYEVDAAFSLGILKGDLSRGLALRLERMILRAFDRFSTISSNMLKLGLAKGVDEDKVVLFPNWVNVEDFCLDRQIHRFDFRSDLNIPKDAVVALYSGNMGAKQGLELLAEAAGRLAENKSLYFIFCGSGPGREGLERRTAGLLNVRFMDLQPSDRFVFLLDAADIHLLPQRADAADLVMPSKLNGILASGRSVVATAHAGTEVERVVSGRGLVVPPEDLDAFVDAIERLSSDKDLRESLGACGKAYAMRNLDAGAVLSTFESNLQSLVGARH